MFQSLHLTQKSKKQEEQVVEDMYGSWKNKNEKLHVKDNRILRPIFPMEFFNRVLQRYAPTGFIRGTWVTGSTIAVREESPGAPSTEIAKGTQIILSKPYANTRYLRNTAEADEVPESPLRMDTMICDCRCVHTRRSLVDAYPSAAQFTRSPVRQAPHHCSRSFILVSSHYFTSVVVFTHFISYSIVKTLVTTSFSSPAQVSLGYAALR